MRLFELTRNLIEIESITGNEKQIAFYLRDYLAGLGYRVTLQEAAPERYNVQAFAGDPVVIFTTHMDTVPPYIASGHQQRVAELARAIGREMGLSQDQLEGLTIASAIHDIGKISLPAEILTKPAQLNSLEMGLIQAHSQAGYDILKNVDFPWPVAQIVLQHHERLNGTGYPKGLSGEGILKAARIVGVADVVETMSSHRPYRPSVGLGKALEEITAKKGILYDPDVVDACLSLMGEKRFEFSCPVFA